MLRPDAILFNGGFFLPEAVRDRVVEAMEGWFSRDGEAWRPKVLVDEVAESAVAVGAAYYAWVRHGGGVRIGAGAPRTYYLGVQAGAGGRPQAVCVLPRGTDPDTTLRLQDRKFRLRTNRPVAFILYSSATRYDLHGEFVSPADADLHRHAPLVTVVRHGGRSRREDLPVTVSATFTEMGTLELWCEARPASQRWRLEFDLHGEAGGGDGAATGAAGSVEAAGRLIRALFGGPDDLIPGESITPEELGSKIEEAVGDGREVWPLAVNRALCDVLSDVAGGRRKGPGYEARWLNLFGFCLRPGFGAEGDERRAALAWEVYEAGLSFPGTVQCQLEWEVFLQRVAGGFDARQQHAVFQEHRARLGSAGGRQAGPGAASLNPQVERFSLRVLASLERLPVEARAELGREVLARVAAAPGDRNALWSLGRLGARVPLYGPASSVVTPAIAAEWIGVLLGLRKLTPEAAFAVAQIGARTDDPARDVGEPVRRAAIARLEAEGLPERLVAPLRAYVAPARADLSRAFGESLPEGLQLVD
jgi:hypothetical protein